VTSIRRPLATLLVGLVCLTCSWKAARASPVGTAIRQAVADPRLPELRRLPLRLGILRATLKPHRTLSLEGRARFLQEIGTLEPDMRRLDLLETLVPQRGADGLPSFFSTSTGDIAPEVLIALDEAGLEREERLFSLAMALFGPYYPTDLKDRKAWFASASNNRNANLFDEAMLLVGSWFGSRDSFADEIDKYVRERPGLLARIERERDATSDRGRLWWLDRQLEQRVDLASSPARVEAELAALPKDYRTLVVLGIFMDEFMNGGVHQFFYDNAGTLAPRVVEAMRDIGLEQQAKVLAKGLAQFREPYPLDTNERRQAYFEDRDWNEWDESLSSLSGDLWEVEDAGMILTHMAQFARAKGLLPD
jgi:hypothetical protein